MEIELTPWIMAEIMHEHRHEANHGNPPEHHGRQTDKHKTYHAQRHTIEKIAVTDLHREARMVASSTSKLNEIFYNENITDHKLALSHRSQISSQSPAILLLVRLGERLNKIGGCLLRRLRR